MERGPLFKRICARNIRPLVYMKDVTTRYSRATIIYELTFGYTRKGRWRTALMPMWRTKLRIDPRRGGEVGILGEIGNVLLKGVIKILNPYVPPPFPLSIC